LARTFVGAVADRLGVDPDARDDAKLAVSELCASLSAATSRVWVEVLEQEDRVVVTCRGVEAPRDDDDGARRHLLLRALVPDVEWHRDDGAPSAMFTIPFDRTAAAVP
jgi:hypothetical protein